MKKLQPNKKVVRLKPMGITGTPEEFVIFFAGVVAIIKKMM